MRTVRQSVCEQISRVFASIWCADYSGAMNPLVWCFSACAGTNRVQSAAIERWQLLWHDSVWTCSGAHAILDAIASGDGERNTERLISLSRERPTGNRRVGLVTGINHGPRTRA